MYRSALVESQQGELIVVPHRKIKLLNVQDLRKKQ